MRSENHYKAAYAQYTTKTVAPNISTTSVVEIGKRHQDNIGNGMRATGEFARNVYQGAVDNAGYIASGLVLAAIGFVAASMLPAEILLGAATGLFVGISALLNDSNNKRN